MVVGVSDSSGVAWQQEGFAPEELLALRRGGRKVNSLKGFLPGIGSGLLPSVAVADLLIEATPGNLKTGEPGLSTVRAALSKGMHVVLANKSPLVLAFDALQNLCFDGGPRMAYSATVCGGLPVINVIQRDLRLARVKRVRGIFNATSNFVLRELEYGGNLMSAIQEAQRLGAAEADPAHDLRGHDSANKLYIIMKSLGGYDGRFDEIRVTGIQEVSAEQLIAARSHGKAIKLLAEAVVESGTWRLSVQPTELPADSFLG